MRLFFLGLVWLAGASVALGDGLPLTTKQVSLMLRSGYSNETVMRELAAHHFGETFDSAVESQLTKAGASPTLLNALRNGSFQASSAEIKAAEEKLAAGEAAAARAQEASTAPAKASGSTEDRPPNQPGVARSTSANLVYQHLKGELVQIRQGAITRFEDEALEQKRYFLFFFSANWDSDGRKFTPTLVDFYNRVLPQHPEFEIIFFSADRSQFGMETYLRQNSMPWPAVAYDKLPAEAAAIDMKNIKTVPCLLLIDSDGRILAKTGEDKTPEDILSETDRILSEPKKIVQTR